MAMSEYTADTSRWGIAIAIAGLTTRWCMHGGAVVALRAFGGPSPHGPRLAPHVWWPRGAGVVGGDGHAHAWVGASVTPCVLSQESVCATASTGPRPMTVRGATVGLVAAGCIALAGGAGSSVAGLAS